MRIFIILKNLIISLLGVRVFNEKQKKLYRIDCFVFAAMIISGVFISTFIMIGGGIRGVVIYNIFAFAMAGAASFAQAFIAKCFGILASYRIGIAAYVLTALTVVILGERINDFLWLSGTLSGISFTFFFVSRNTMILSYADYNQDVESVYLGSMGTTNSIFAFVFPVLAGIFITSMTGINLSMTGYYVIFSAGILLYLTGFIMTFFIPKPTPKNTNSKLWADVRILLRKKAVIFSGFGELFRGMLDVIAGFIFAMLVFEVTRTEAWVGTFGMVMAVCQFIGFFVFTRYTNLKRAKNFLLIFALTAAITPWLFLTGVQLWTLFMVGGAAFLAQSFQNSANVICSNAIDGYVEGGFLIREIFIITGRMIGLTILFFLSQMLKMPLLR